MGKKNQCEIILEKKKQHFNIEKKKHHLMIEKKEATFNVE
jgi:hypothetical protein